MTWQNISLSANGLIKCVAALPLLHSVTEGRSSKITQFCGFVITSLDNLLIDMQTKCNIVMLMQQRMYASIRKNGTWHYKLLAMMIRLCTLFL